MTRRQFSPLDRAAAIVGSYAALQRQLGLSARSTIHSWKYRGSVPAPYCVPIERLTGGRVTRHDLRPDVFGAAEAAE